MKYPLSRPDITRKEIDAVRRVLESGRLSLGPQLAEFEKQLANVAARKEAIATSSGTAALHLIMRALDIRAGDEVITSPLSFIASTNCIEYVGAKPVFVDVLEETACIDPAAIEQMITSRTKAILAVDAYGFPAEYRELRRIAREHELYLIEDSAEALGAAYEGKPCGSFGDASVYAFYANKPITTAEGGAVLVNDPGLARRVRSLLNQGRELTDDGWGERHEELGYNYRLSDVHSAIGREQLNRFETIRKRRRQIIRWYQEAITRLEVPVTVPSPYELDDPSIFSFVTRLPSPGLQEAVTRALARDGVQSRSYFYPIHLQPWYRKKYGYRDGMFPRAESWGASALALPLYSGLTKKDVGYIAGCLKLALADESIQARIR
ncbi:MAG: DegT/DnrJ/EryC1/StrS family aminotransferase [Candidatus Paceibacterota bacterium]